MPAPKKWKTYAFEFLSIFVAVVSAFALNHWNDNRNSRNAENKILSEIYTGLEKDLADIRLNVNGHKKGIDAAIYMRELIAGKAVIQDSLMMHYFTLTRDFVSIQNTSGYETLKSRGLELIRNDSLRSKIIALYEYDYNVLRKLEEEYYELQFQENYFKEINQLLAPNFQFNDEKFFIGIKIPLEINTDQEKVLLTYLWKMHSNRMFILQFYAEVEQKIEALRKEIAMEIN